MIWSLNETESAAKKAARGAGMSWGLAEEAGRATRWLCAAGWPGAEGLAALLAAEDGAAWEAIRPQINGERWVARGGTLCPVAAGAALCDRAGEWAKGRRARLEDVAQPLLLVPFLAMAADITGARLRIAWPGVEITRGEGRTLVAVQSEDALRAARAEVVEIGPAQELRGEELIRAWRAEVPDETARALGALAHRTYAPATPESRLAGAGAGLTDND